MNNCFYSIIVPSYNRKDEIQELLESFMQLEFPQNRYEIIIADDGSSDGTDKLILQYQESSSISLKYLSQKNQGPGRARNLGMENANGDFFIFIDSDCTVERTWLKEIDAVLGRDNFDAFGGPDDCRDDFPPLLKAINYSMTSFLTTGGIRGHKKKKIGKFYPRSFNMGLSKKLYAQIGGFGTLRHGQDIEFSNRIIRSGAKVARIEKAVVFHKRRTSIKKFFKQVFNWGVARINLYKLDSAMLEPVHFFPAIALWVTILFTMSAFIHPLLSKIFVFFSSFGVLLLAASAVHAGIINRNLKTALLILIIIPTQIYGYGIGFSLSFFKRVILHQKEFTGFTRKYYK